MSRPLTDSVGSGLVVPGPVALDQIAATIGIGERSVISFVGGGGKTTTMFAVGASLARADVALGRPGVVMTTTTKMSARRTDNFPVLVGATVDEIAAAATGAGTGQALGSGGWFGPGSPGGGLAGQPILAWRSVVETKALGHSPDFCDALAQRVAHVLVEADGARQRPLTAPGPFEPVLPRTTTHVLAMIGADAIGRCIGDQCHRPLRVAALAGCRPYDRLTPARAARVLLSTRGLRKNVPPSARYVVAVTKVTEPVDDDVAELVGRLAGELGPAAVIPVAMAKPSEEQPSR